VFQQVLAFWQNVRVSTQRAKGIPLLVAAFDNLRHQSSPIAITVVALLIHSTLSKNSQLIVHG
jgi:hypothetical protein